MRIFPGPKSRIRQEPSVLNFINLADLCPIQIALMILLEGLVKLKILLEGSLMQFE